MFTAARLCGPCVSVVSMTTNCNLVCYAVTALRCGAHAVLHCRKLTLAAVDPADMQQVIDQLLEVRDLPVELV